MIKTIKELSKDSMLKPHDFGDAICYSTCLWVHPKGQTPDYFNGEELLKRHLDLKLWVSLGGSNMTFEEDGKTYYYPVPYYNKLLAAIEKSGFENDVYMLCHNDIGGDANKTYPKFRESWTGKFI